MTSSGGAREHTFRNGDFYYFTTIQCCVICCHSKFLRAVTPGKSTWDSSYISCNTVCVYNEQECVSNPKMIMKPWWTYDSLNTPGLRPTITAYQRSLSIETGASVNPSLSSMELEVSIFIVVPSAWSPFTEMGVATGTVNSGWSPLTSIQYHLLRRAWNTYLLPHNTRTWHKHLWVLVGPD